MRYTGKIKDVPTGANFVALQALCDVRPLHLLDSDFIGMVQPMGTEKRF